MDVRIVSETPSDELEQCEDGIVELFCRPRVTACASSVGHRPGKSFELMNGFDLALTQQHHGVMEIIFQESLKANINLNATDDKEQTVSHHSCIEGDVKMVELIRKNEGKHNIYIIVSECP